MTSKRLILLLLVTLWLPVGAKATVPVADAVLSECPSVERPQWKDIGLCDVLAVTGSTTVAPPTTVRVLHDSPTGDNVTTQATQARHYSTLHLVAYGQRHTVSGYIYLIRSLRL